MNIVDQSKTLLMTVGAAPIMYVLIASSIGSLAVIAERSYFFYRTRDDVPALARKLRTLLDAGDTHGSRRLLHASPSPAAAIVLAGLEEAAHGPESAEEAMHGALATQRARLERRLAFLGTLGNNAPFIGLFGTVIGIVMAFEKLGEAGARGSAAGGSASSAIMSSIAEALVATAIGLFVALPAVAAYNTFQRLIKGVLASADTLTRVLLASLKARPADPRFAAIVKRAGEPRALADDTLPRALDVNVPEGA